MRAFYDQMVPSVTKDVLKKLMDRRMMMTINSTMDNEAATMIAREFGAEVQLRTFEQDMLEVEAEEIKPEDEGLDPRAFEEQAQHEAQRCTVEQQQRIAILYAERVDTTGDRMAKIRWVTSRLGRNPPITARTDVRAPSENPPPCSTNPGTLR